MPDTSLGRGFLETAGKLIAEDRGDHTQADLRRAVSCCYYAVFHSLAKACADSLVGADPAERSDNAWVEAYRGLDHGKCYSSCESAAKIKFPESLKQFALEFMQLQVARHRADYDPKARVQMLEAMFFMTMAEGCIQALEAASAKDMTAFATWMLITSKGAEKARKLPRDGSARQLLVLGAVAPTTP